MKCRLNNALLGAKILKISGERISVLFPIFLGGRTPLKYCESVVLFKSVIFSEGPQTKSDFTQNFSLICRFEFNAS